MVFVVMRDRFYSRMQHQILQRADDIISAVLISLPALSATSSTIPWYCPLLPDRSFATLLVFHAEWLLYHNHWLLDPINCAQQIESYDIFSPPSIAQSFRQYVSLQRITHCTSNAIHPFEHCFQTPISHSQTYVSRQLMEMFPRYSYDARRLHALSVVEIELGARHKCILWQILYNE